MDPLQIVDELYQRNITANMNNYKPSGRLLTDMLLDRTFNLQNGPVHMTAFGHATYFVHASYFDFETGSFKVIWDGEICTPSASRQDFVQNCFDKKIVLH